MKERKYKLVRLGFFQPVWGNLNWTVYRVKALHDIPRYGVKAGDIGGYVTGKKTLSQEGDCWISYDATVLGNVFVSDNAYVTDKAFVGCDSESYFIRLSGNARIGDEAHVSVRSNSKDDNPTLGHVITGDVYIAGKATVTNLEYADGNIDIYGEASLRGVRRISGTVDICGTANIEAGAIIGGNTRIIGNASVGEDAIVMDCILRNNSVIAPKTSIYNKTLGDTPDLKESPQKLKRGKTEAELIDSLLHQLSAGLPQKNDNNVKRSATPAQVKAGKPKPSKEDTAIADALNLLEEVKFKLHQYESDIVKILKYPVMTDSTDPFTLDMMAGLNLANRLSLNPYHEDFVASVYALEKKFMAAEANAIKIASTRLSDAEKKKTEFARDLLRIAANEASSENEKEMAFAQGFKQLEGIILVPEVAVDTFRVKIGLKELESL